MQVKGFPATRVRRYPNSLSTFNLSRLTICGDIELNPGLDNKPATCKPAWKFSCDVCMKPVHSNQKCIICDGCKKRFHLMCITIELWKYLELSSSDHNGFLNERVSPIHSLTQHSSDSCNGFPKGLLLNVQSLHNKIEDLHALLLTDSFDVTTLTDTWLDKDFHYGELHLDGYNIFRCDRCG